MKRAKAGARVFLVSGQTFDVVETPEAIDEIVTRPHVNAHRLTLRLTTHPRRRVVRVRWNAVACYEDA